MRRHIKTPSQKTYEKVNLEFQLLISNEEITLIEKLLFLEDFNIPARKSWLDDSYTASPPTARENYGGKLNL